MQKPTNKNIEKRKVHSSFMDNIWGAELTDMKLISTFNKVIRFFIMLLIFSLNTHVLFFLKIKKAITIANAFQKILHESNPKPNKIWIDKGSEFYNRTMKSWLQENNLDMHPTINEEKSVVAERFIRT